MAERATAIPYRVLHYEDTPATPLTDVVAFGVYAGELVFLRANGDVFRSDIDSERQRDLATRARPHFPRDLRRVEAREVRGVYYVGGEECVGVGDDREDCGHGLRPRPAGRQYPSLYPVCRLVGGSVECRGGHLSGRWIHRRRPAPIATRDRFVDIAGSPTRFCGATTTGEVRCWGPGVGTVEGVSDAVAVSARPREACALTRSGEVWCWSGDALARRVAPLPPAVQLGVNESATCALDAAGEVRCWGAFGHAWPGHPRVYRARRPLDVALPEPVTALLSTASMQMCARTATATVRCWGGPADAWNEDRAIASLGDTAEPTSWTVPESARESGLRLEGGRVLLRDATPRGWSALGDLPPVRSLALGGATTCALAVDGQVWCWGYNHYGELGLDDAPRPDVRTPVMTVAPRAATTR